VCGGFRGERREKKRTTPRRFLAAPQLGPREKKKEEGERRKGGGKARNGISCAYDPSRERRDLRPIRGRGEGRGKNRQSGSICLYLIPLIGEKEKKKEGEEIRESVGFHRRRKGKTILSPYFLSLQEVSKEEGGGGGEEALPRAGNLHSSVTSLFLANVGGRKEKGGGGRGGDEKTLI